MNANTLDKIRKLKLFGMFRAFKTSLETDGLNKYTIDEMTAFLVEAEWEDRQNRSTERRLTNAHFRYKASIEEMYYQADRSLERNQIGRLAECTFINRLKNVLITGSTGIGKSYIASAIGQQACISGYRVLYASTPKLFARLRWQRQTALT